MKWSELIIDVYADDDWKQVSYVSDCQTADRVGALVDYILTMCGVPHELHIKNCD